MKQISMKSLLVLVLFTMTVFPAQAQMGDSGIKILTDVEYASVDGHRLLLDLHLPEKVEGAPLLIWVHGGAWRRGSKSRMPPCGSFASDHSLGTSSAGCRRHAPGA